jgi:hypothetical protein
MSTLLAQQQAFTRHIRDPQRAPLPAGVEPRRMRIYNELVYNTIEGFVAGGFPVLRALLDDAAWHAMVREFVATHRCHTPYFLRISEEFIAFLAEPRPSLALPPFAHELAHYEWVELALDVAEDVAPEDGLDPGGDLLQGKPVLNPLLFALSYVWPVHRIGREYRPDTAPPEPTRLIVYRNRDLEVKFLESNVLTLRLLELLADASPTGEVALQRLAGELGQTESVPFGVAGQQTLERLRALGVILGTRAAAG